MSETARFPSFRQAPSDAAQLDELVWLLDMQAELPSVRRLRGDMRAALGVRSGQRVLDVGSGTGSEAVELAALVGPGGEAIGLDTNPGMVEMARERTAGTSARFVAGSVYDLPFPDGHFDAVRCERVYQHLDDPAAATAEIVRVLRAGGRVLLADSDWYTAIAHPGDPAVVQALREFLLIDTPNPASGRYLRGLLTAAGCAIDDVAAHTVVWEAEQFRAMYTELSRRAVDGRTITVEQREGFLADLDAGIAVGDFHLSVTMFAVLAHRG